uniref:Uncharacterized protein n=1 Tax=Lyngbya confervoides BDU141951 TaxID=1574623 RepID=A0A8T6QMB0_9CYAN
MGRQNVGSRKQWNRVVKRYHSKLNFVELGKRDAEFVSQFLQACDWGLSTTQFEFLGKSSSISAMLCHGLTILFNEKNPDFNVESQLSPFYSREQISFGLPDSLVPIKHPCLSKNARIAQKFSEVLACEL